VEFWQHDFIVGEAFVPEFKERKLVRMRAHESEERFYKEKYYPVKGPGTRFYVAARPYVLIPEVHIEIELYPRPRGLEVGRVVRPEWVGMREIEIGNAQAWAYPEDRVVILWECYIFEPNRAKVPVKEDDLYVMVFKAFEKFLVDRFKPKVIVTPRWEPTVKEEEYIDFLKFMRYSPYNEMMWRKQL